MRIGKNGQMMLISVLIMVVLVISVAMIMFLNQVNAKFGLMRRNSQQASAGTEAGLDYAIHVLSVSTTTWYNALQGQYPAEFFDASGPNGLHLYNPTLSNTAYTISCSSSDLSTFSIYQLRVIVKSYTDNKRGTWVPNRAMSALISQRTLSANLNNNTSAALAMQFMNVTQSNWNVHWGPIASYDNTNTWNLGGSVDSKQHPRKLALQGITGGSFPRSEPSGSRPSSDGVEYWAYTAMGNPPDIDTLSYQAIAQGTPFSGNVPLSSASFSPGPATAVPIDCPVVGVPNCSDFKPVVGDTAVFTGGYSYQQPGTTIFIEGNAELGKAFLDLKGDRPTTVFPSSGSLIVQGNLTINDLNVAPLGSHSVNYLRIPPTVSLEYPYSNSLPYPCSSATLPYCSSSGNTNSGKIFFRGFLYVTGDLHYQLGGNTLTYHEMVGAARVDGTFSTQFVGTGSSFIFYYDDEINHSILTNTLQLQVDSTQPVSAS